MLFASHDRGLAREVADRILDLAGPSS